MQLWKKYGEITRLIFENTSFRGMIGSIKSVFSCFQALQKLEWNPTKRNLSKLIFPFYRRTALFAAKIAIWQPQRDILFVFEKKNLFEKWHDLNQIDSVKVLWWHLQTKFGIMNGSFRKILQTWLFNPSNRLFQKPLGSYFERFLVWCTWRDVHFNY